MKLCDRIKQYRQDNNLTQQDLADKLFVSRSAVAKWEQGRGLPDKHIQKLLSTMLNVPEEELMLHDQLHNITIEPTASISKRKRSNLLIFIMIGAIFITLAVLLFCFPTEKAPPNIITESEYTYIDEVNDSSISFFRYYGDYEKYTHCLTPNLREITFDSNVSCFDRGGNETEISSLKSGYSVKITYSYPENSKDDVTVDKIEIIDDYARGDYYIKGFFLSTEAYNGDVIPIYSKSLGFTDYKPPFKLPGGYSNYEYFANGSYYGPAARYPYMIWPNKHQFVGGGLIPYIPNPQLVKNPVTSCVFDMVYNTTVTLSSEINNLFIYVIDNSERGFTLYSILKTDTLITIPCLIYEETNDRPLPEKARSMRRTCNLNVVFNNTLEYVFLQEFDENYNAIKATLLKNAEEVYYEFKLQENTAFVIVAQNEKSTTILARGDKIRLSLPYKYGYMKDKLIEFI